MKNPRVVRALLSHAFFSPRVSGPRLPQPLYVERSSDQSGALVPGASVTLSRPDTGFTAKMTSNSEGAYIFQQLPPGTYELTADSAGFATQTVRSRCSWISLPQLISR